MQITRNTTTTSTTAAVLSAQVNLERWPPLPAHVAAQCLWRGCPVGRQCPPLDVYSSTGSGCKPQRHGPAPALGHAMDPATSIAGARSFLVARPRPHGWGWGGRARFERLQDHRAILYQPRNVGRVALGVASPRVPDKVCDGGLVGQHRASAAAVCAAGLGARSKRGGRGALGSRGTHQQSRE